MKPEKLAEHVKATVSFLTDVVVTPGDCQRSMWISKEKITFEKNCSFWGSATVSLYEDDLLWKTIRGNPDDVPYGEIIDIVRQFSVVNYGRKNPIWQKKPIKSQLRRIKNEIIQCCVKSVESLSNQKKVREAFEKDVEDHYGSLARNAIRRLIQEHGERMNEEMIASAWRESVVWGVIKE